MFNNVDGLFSVVSNSVVLAVLVLFHFCGVLICFCYLLSCCTAFCCCCLIGMCLLFDGLQVSDACCSCWIDIMFGIVGFLQVF